MQYAISGLLAVSVIALWGIRLHLREWHIQWEMERSIARHGEMMASLSRCHQGPPLFDQDRAA